jgi:uncharacterized protein YaaW (UPF0174 family)
MSSVGTSVIVVVRVSTASVGTSVTVVVPVVVTVTVIRPLVLSGQR